MPIFEYHCDDCDKNFEELVYNEDEAIKCTHCGSENTKKLISCCRFKEGGPKDMHAVPNMAHRSKAATSSACSTCTGGNCSTCM